MISVDSLHTSEPDYSSGTQPGDGDAFIVIYTG